MTLLTSVVRYGNLFYMFYIILAVLITLAAVRFLKPKSERFRFWFLFGILVSAFIVHFLKIFIYPYTTLDNVWRKVSLENICAVSTVIFPFIYFTKNKVLKDYMIMVGLASGVLTFFLPIDAVSPMFDGEFLGVKNALSLEVFRFYYAHFALFLVPFLMMHFNMHKISIKRSLMMPAMLLMVLLIIYINELVLSLLGWVPKENLYNPEKRNPSLIFGFKGSVTGISILMTMFVPTFFTVGPISGEAFYWPVIWMIIPVYVYGMLIALTICYIYDKEATINVFKRLFRIHRDKPYKHIE